MIKEHKIVFGKLQRKRPVEDLDVDGGIILK
jgi:hypothetical protein